MLDAKARLVVSLLFFPFPLFSLPSPFSFSRFSETEAFPNDIMYGFETKTQRKEEGKGKKKIQRIEERTPSDANERMDGDCFFVD